ncbi:MAG: hypothetical protein AMXMBFR83_02100 [Phycisphaerae bacterium]
MQSSRGNGLQLEGKQPRVIAVIAVVTAAVALPASGADGPNRASTPPGAARVRIGAYWWDGWFEGSPYIRPPLTTEFKGREPQWGWRDDNQQAVDESIRLAADYGIDFFAFLWYPPDAWRFPNGQPSDVMNNGLRFFLASQEPQRRSVGFLLMITHAPSKDEWEPACRRWVQEYLVHDRYVRVADKPALFFYELSELDAKLGGRERVRPALDRLRQNARQEKGLELFLVLRAQRDESHALAELGFDGATDYAVAYAPTPGEHPYHELVSAGMQVWSGYEGRRAHYIPSITAGWDGRPRAWMGKEHYRYWYRRSPTEFGAFVRRGLDWLLYHPQEAAPEPLLMIYAWNEIDEGGAICPTKQDGPAYLQALQDAVSSILPSATRPQASPASTTR